MRRGVIIIRRDCIWTLKASEINIFDRNSYLAFEDFDLGDEMAREMRFDANDEEFIEFRKIAFNYVLNFLLEMQILFENFKNPLYVAAECLRPANAKSKSYRNSDDNHMENLLEICRSLTKGDQTYMNNVYLEWFLLSQEKWDEKVVGTMTAFDFWMFVKCEMNAYRNVSQSALDVLKIPIFNAQPERTFSEENNDKTKNKNKMRINTSSRQLLAREAVKDYTLNGRFKPTEDMVKRILEGRYYKNKYSTDDIV